VSNLVDHIEESIINRRLFQRGQSILVAVSGGLDSMVLLHVLHRLSGKYKWRLTVAHFNHQLRGRSSDADERMVRRATAELKLLIVVGRAAVRQFAARHGLSVEMAARQLRHEFLARTAKRRKVWTVAMAHHADDQVELFFLRMLRGAGGEGLAGMKWAGDSPVDPTVKLVRPLLDLDKAELTAFARQQRIEFREDASNRAIQFQRNRIRHELIPLLRKTYQPALGRTILRLMEIVGEEAAFVKQTAQRWLKHKRHSAFLRLPVAVQRQVIQLQLLELGVVADFDLTVKLFKAADQVIAVNPQLSVYRDSSGRVHSRKAETAGFIDEQSTLDLAEGKGTHVFDRLNIRWQIQPPRGLRSTKANAPCEYFDAGKVGSPILLRHWRPGDRFQPIGMPSPVKMQDLFTNLKIPRHERRRLVVAASGSGELFWVEGVRISELFKLDKQTIQVLKWEWHGV
jgi:tRNA(Ile)-lysidine synthase